MQTEFPEKYRILGLKIAYYRKKAGYTQEVFAEKINKSIKLPSHWRAAALLVLDNSTPPSG